MSKLIRLSPSGIEYLDYAWNFYSGCRHKQDGKCPPYPCWAGEFTGRFKKTHYPNGFNPTFYPEAFLSPLTLSPSKGRRIGVCFMGDLFGEWVDPLKTYTTFIKDSVDGTDIHKTRSLRRWVYDAIEECPQHTFIFLTKNPAGLIPWLPFPDNCEVGFSAWSPESFLAGLRHLSGVEAKVKWCSLEPLLDWPPPVILREPGDRENPVAGFSTLDWVAIGGLTGTKGQIDTLAPQYPALTPRKLGEKGNRWGLMPPVAWLKNIVESCDSAGTKVFIKDNLKSWLLDEAENELCLFKTAEDWEEGFQFRQECGARQDRKLTIVEFLKLSDNEKVKALHPYEYHSEDTTSDKSTCSQCGKPADAGDYCFGCKKLICLDCVEKEPHYSECLSKEL